MRKSFNIFSLLLLFATLSACRGEQVLADSEQGDTIQFRYARHITAIKYADSIVVSMADPWHEGHTLCKYVLLDKTHPSSSSLRSSSHILVPLSNSVVFNTAHASLLEMLGCLDAVGGVCDLRYMQLPEVHRRTKLDAQHDSKAIVDCGDGMAPDIEGIIEIEPDALLLSPFEDSGSHGALGKLGIPMIECADYMETSALGRAEWMRFYGMLFGCTAEADSLFEVVEREYLKIKSQASKATSRLEKGGGKRPLMLTERLTQGTWYVPGGQSSMSLLIQDAGARYAWSADKHCGSLPLTFEAVLDKASDADVWVFNYIGREPLTYTLLLAENAGYNEFRAFKEHSVWYVNSLSVPYFEEVSFRPDKLLRDYVTLLYPELHLGIPRYLHPVEE